MKTTLSAKTLTPLLLALAVLVGHAPFALSAAEPKSDAKQQQTKRAPLKISVDRKPINRDAPDRISYAPIIKRTAASVVYVYSSKKVRAQDIHPFFNDPMFRRFFDLPELPGGGGGPGGGGRGSRRAPEQTQQGLGSGVVITADGYILTNNHVVEGADDVKVQIGESTRRYEAEVVGRDALSDLAVLKIEATGLTPAVFGDSEQLQVGDVVLAIGNPFGVGQSVSRGIVSALSRGVGFGPFEDFIQTDAAINPGNSGGALIDTEGRVVGINTAILSRSGGFNGVGFAIPINLVRSIAEQIVNTGRVDRGMLGVVPQDLDQDLAEEFGTDKGVVIAEVNPDTPAEKAGLKTGDVITKINETEIRDTRHLVITVSQMAPGTKITVHFMRDKKPQSVELTLARRTDDRISRSDSGSGEDIGVLNGVTVSDITDELRDRLSLPSPVQGAIITEIDPESPSARQGLREGDIILELDRRPVKNAEEAVRLSEEIKGPKVMVLISRNGRNQFLVIDESRK